MIGRARRRPGGPAPPPPSPPPTGPPPQQEPRPPPPPPGGWAGGRGARGPRAAVPPHPSTHRHEVILDVMAIAAGFVLRAMAGAYAIDVPISPWLYVVTALGALFLAITKRRAEVALLQENAGNHRATLDHYTPALVDQMTAMVTASTVIAYALYTFTAENLPSNHTMMLTIPFVAYALLP